jgi:cation-transporting ATPase F
LILIPAVPSLLVMEFAWAKRSLRRARTLVATRQGSNEEPPAGKPSSARRRPLRRPVALVAVEATISPSGFQTSAMNRMNPTPTAPSNPAWHQINGEEAARNLEVDPRVGLSADEVGRRQARHGPNRLPGQKRRSEWVRFLLQFHQPLLYILLAAAAVTAFLQEWVDASVIFGVVLINAAIGYFQEGKAERAIEALAGMVVTEATVRRDGRKQRVPSEQLVPGDVVLLQSGDHVPADLRLIHVRDLQVDESALTGESVPVEKHLVALDAETVLAERRNLAFAGTLVTYGQAEGLVWAIGSRTETGRIARLIHEAGDLSTPLTRKIAHFSKVLLLGILALAALTFVLGVLRGGAWSGMFMAAVALAVGAIPEGLPAAVTITLAIGVARMARRGAIIRKLPAVETLGSTTVICSDKTGTLTENQMTVQRVRVGVRLYEVTGAGYEPQGDILWNGQPASRSGNPGLEECLQAGWLCNDAQLVRQNGRHGVQGDPTEGALIAAAQKFGLNEPELHTRHPRLDTVPFESEHQYMATLHADPGGGQVVYLKGAVERVVERCADGLTEDGVEIPLDREQVHREAEALAVQGLRVLAFARKRLSTPQACLAHDDVREGLTLLGLQGMMDPPRAEAVTAVRRCRRAGIRVKMITGDHVLTAQAVARQIGLNGDHVGGEPVAVTGRELEVCSRGELSDVAERAAVFARVTPEQKLRLVQALQGRGHVVAMTGDGVNDAPALKQADIGVAMGVAGTDVAKSAADMMLTDDNFATIEAAVEEGRNVFDNLTKFIIWTLPTNFGMGLVILAAIVMGTVLPVLPVQVLYINMSTALLLGLMLVFEPRESDVMARPPRVSGQPILTHELLMRTGLVTLLILAGAFGLFLWEQQRGGSLAQARTTAVNLIVMVQVLYLFNCRSLTRSALSVGLLSNRWAIAGAAGMISLQFAITYLPLLNRLLHTAPIPADSWMWIAGVAFAAYAVVGFEKWIRFRSSTAGERTTPCQR